jgi:signal transduction histidine kinase
MLGLRAMEETTSDSRVLENARSLRAMGAVIHEDLRRIVRGLRPAILDQLGLVAAMERLVEDLSRPGKMSIELDTSRLAGLRLNNELESNAFRILQEAISNSLRHSSAKHICVTIGIQNDELDITVSDDGIGFDSSVVFQNEHGSYGLLSIRERAMICGGRAEIQTSIGSGTKVSARLPLTMRSPSND